MAYETPWQMWRGANRPFFPENRFPAEEAETVSLKDNRYAVTSTVLAK
jgi:hypothetical protein